MSGSPGTATGAWCRCSATSCAGSRASASRTRSRASSASADVTLDTELDAAALRELTERFRSFFDFPTDPQQQLTEAIRAVFDSWMGERAIQYRRINRLPDDWGTAVNVQQMVYGNKGETSCSGVAFSRDEVTGAPEPSGDFLPNAQGEDVVSGVRTPRDLAELRELDAGGRRSAPRDPAHARGATTRTCRTPSSPSRRDACSCSRRAAPSVRRRRRVRFAVDAFEERLLTQGRGGRDDRRRRARGTAAPVVRHRRRGYTVLARGVAASPGAAKGTIVFTAPDAVAQAADGSAVILVRPFTEADDVAGFHAAVGILTSEGGKASHAALVARGMGRPAVTGAAAIWRSTCMPARCGSATCRLREGDFIAIDGTTGAITDRRRPARRGPRRRALRDRPALVRRAARTSACAPTPTRPRTPRVRTGSEPRESGCAGPSTCSWRPTASPRCGR